MTYLVVFMVGAVVGAAVLGWFERHELRLILAEWEARRRAIAEWRGRLFVDRERHPPKDKT